MNVETPKKSSKKAPLPSPNGLWPFTRVDSKILERMHRAYLKANKPKSPEQGALL